MSRLLIYLVDQQLLRNDQVTIGMIAFEALGKQSEDGNDADAYARLQIGRLRQVMESYYAQYSGPIRLYLPNRRYQFELIPVAAKPPTFETPDFDSENDAVMSGKFDMQREYEEKLSSVEDDKIEHATPLKNRPKVLIVIAVALAMAAVVYLLIR